MTLLFACNQVFALGFGPDSINATMGSALDFSVPVRVASGGDVDSSCVSAAVRFGDIGLMPDQFSVSIGERDGNDEQTVRITTKRVIDEPLVVVEVSVKCDGDFTRQFTALASPQWNRPKDTRSAIASAGPREPGTTRKARHQATADGVGAGLAPPAAGGSDRIDWNAMLAETSHAVHSTLKLDMDIDDAALAAGQSAPTVAARVAVAGPVLVARAARPVPAAHRKIASSMRASWTDNVPFAEVLPYSIVVLLLLMLAMLRALPQRARELSHPQLPVALTAALLSHALSRR